MENRIKIYNRIALLGVFVAIPIFFYLFGDFPRRTLLKEIISLLTILAFFVLLMQFFLSRANKKLLKVHKMGRVIKWHKVLGYVFTSILILHPFLVVFPKYFETGIGFKAAFSELITNFNQLGLLLGLLAWGLMIIIGIMSFFRDKLFQHYKTWRVFHGINSILFIAMASYHVIDMGRHINKPMIWLIGILSIMAISLLLKTYIFKLNQTKEKNHD